MIKKLTTLSVLFIILFVGCAKKDDTAQEEGQTSTNIYKFKQITYYEVFEPDVYEMWFNEDGTLQRDFGYTEGNDSNYNFFEYNDQGQLTSVDLYSQDGQFLEHYLDYEYNSSNQLIKKITNYYPANTIYNTVFTYSGSTVNFVEQETGKTGSLVFDGANRLIETNHMSGPTTITTKNLSYDNNGNITQVETDFGSDLYLEFDTSTNPLSGYLTSNQIAFTAGFDIDFSGSPHTFTVNNVTKESLGNNRISEMTYEYNSQGYPISCTIMRNGELRSTQTFEYY